MLRRPERLKRAGQTNLPTNYDRRYNNRDEIYEDKNEDDNKNNNTSWDPGTGAAWFSKRHVCD